MKLKQRLLTVLILVPTMILLFILTIKLSRKPEPRAAPGSRDLIFSQVPNKGTLRVDTRKVDQRSDGRSVTVQSNISVEDAWAIWRKWVEPDYLYPLGAFQSSEMRHILVSMATSSITSFGLGYKGTQLKATVMLGQQKTAFKPKRYERDHVILGEPYAGFDRHNGEIAGFHLDGILGFRIAPPVVGRKINLTKLKSVTSEKLLKTYFMKGRDVCFYGQCYYCKREEAACGDGDIMEGSLTLWLPEWYQLKTRRHPYQRTYKKSYKARWETDDSYCHRILRSTSEYYHGILEFTDSAIYDFLMGNADRHHYETYFKAKFHGRMLHFDNGKTFGDPGHDEMSILAPLRQCCRVRRSTWERLKTLNGNLSRVLDESLRNDPLYPILTDAHLEAIDRRHAIVMETIEQCMSIETAIVDKWP